MPLCTPHRTYCYLWLFPRIKSRLLFSSALVALGQNPPFCKMFAEATTNPDGPKESFEMAPNDQGYPGCRELQPLE